MSAAQGAGLNEASRAERTMGANEALAASAEVERLGMAVAAAFLMVV